MARGYCSNYGPTSTYALILVMLLNSVSNLFKMNFCLLSWTLFLNQLLSICAQSCIIWLHISFILLSVVWTRYQGDYVLDVIMLSWCPLITYLQAPESTHFWITGGGERWSLSVLFVNQVFWWTKHIEFFLAHLSFCPWCMRLILSLFWFLVRRSSLCVLTDDEQEKHTFQRFIPYIDSNLSSTHS